MDVKNFRTLLLDKKQELEQQMAQIEKDSHQRNTPEVQDGVDLATASEERSSAWGQATREWSVYTQVRNALARIDQGSFGDCLDCGRAIEPGRLEAVPWAAYCLKDQEKREQAERLAGGPNI
ncbi:MAG TPA: RNA polymerase-binding protein DksA [Solibacterales bacterium]|nr:RNA polymerase-binding protein DksA [Bryobacterales bacterium]